MTFFVRPGLCLDQSVNSPPGKDLQAVDERVSQKPKRACDGELEIKLRPLFKSSESGKSQAQVQNLLVEENCNLASHVLFLHHVACE